jgi:hypothetical protein
VTKFDASSQTDDDKPDYSGNAKDFLNKLSSKFESSEKSMLINTNDDFGTSSNLLQTSDNGKSDDSCHVNDSVNEVAITPENHKKSMRTVTHDNIAICSDKEFSLENKQWKCHAAN